MLDFSNAPSEQMTGDLIPEKTLSWGIITVRPYNAQEGKILTPSNSNPDNAYLDIEVTLKGGRFDKRKVFEKLHLQNSEKAANQARAQVRAALEVGKGANVQTNPQGYHLQDYMGLDGLQVAIEVGFEKGDPGYKDKNTIKAFLTPNPDAGSSIAAKWDALLRGDEKAMYPVVGSTGSAAAQGNLPLNNASAPATGQAAPSWMTQQGGNPAQGSSTPQTSPSTSSAPTQAAPAKPSWLQS